MPGRGWRCRGAGHAAGSAAARLGGPRRLSKATIYNRFGGRSGLIDAVIEELVACDIRRAIAKAQALDDPWQRIVSYVTDHRDLQYREPATVDVILMDHPDSPHFVDRCNTASQAAEQLITDGHQAGVIRADFTIDDFNDAIVATALTLRHWAKPPRAAYDRRTRFFLDSVRPTPTDLEAHARSR